MAGTDLTMWNKNKRLFNCLQQKFAFSIILICVTYNGAAQICQGSLGDPIVNITFGAGANPGAPLPAATTNYTYVNTDCPRDGEYAVRNKTEFCFDTLWNAVTDHTGDANGYFMLVNASFNPGHFYLDTVRNLCAGSTYEFAAWLVNISKPILCWGASQIVVPNITFQIERTDGTILQSYNTGDIPATSPTQWNQYGFFFTTPVGVNEVVLRMVNNAPGGCGNDVGLDDITFRPCGPQVTSSIIGTTSPTNDTLCNGSSRTYIFQAQTSPGYNNPVYQWQASYNGGAWSDITGETNQSCTVTLSATTAAGNYSYRLLVAESGNINSPNCRVASNDIDIHVKSKADIVASSNTPVCEGLTLTLSCTGNNITWQGPNGYTATGNNVSISEVQQINAGDYYATSQDGSCSWKDTVTVAVSSRPVISTNVDSATVCEGDKVQIIVSGASSYQWTPATGISDVSQDTVTAGPTSTTTYSVVGANANQCTDTATVTVTVFKKPKANAGLDIGVLKGTTVHLNGSVEGDQVSYSWSPEYMMLGSETLSPSVTPEVDTSYVLTVTSDAGCGDDSDTVKVTIFKEVIVPNAFSPNGDGKNDVWNIAGLNGYSTAVIVVFDRYGREVMRSHSYQPWDGKKNGQPLPIATYYYVIDLRNGAPKLAGYVYLAR